MNILGLVLARGGSRRVPGKNTRLLGDKPLIAWTIESALESGVLSDVVVSTDDERIAAVSRQWGATVPWLRPSELATDKSPSIDAIIHALEWAEQAMERIDAVMLLQPTSPFRSALSIAAAVKKFREHNSRPVVSFSPAPVIPEWCFRETEGGITPVLGWDDINRRSQEFSPTYQLNGAIYIATPETLRKERGFLCTSTVPFVMTDEMESTDIDTEEDWERAESFVQIE